MYFLLLPCMMFSQNVRYEYDEAGNRISRVVIIKTRSSHEDFENRSFHDAFYDKNFIITSNNNLLCVDFLEIGNTDRVSTALFNVSGVKMVGKSVKSNHIEIGLSHIPNGVYILQVIFNDDKYFWKIVKR